MTDTWLKDERFEAMVAYIGKDDPIVPKETPKKDAPKKMSKNALKKAAKNKGKKKEKPKWGDGSKNKEKQKAAAKAKSAVVVPPPPKTPKGQKKDMSAPMNEAYYPSHVEEGWQSWWEESGFYKPPEPSTVAPDASKFTMVIPPPNVTGSLHLGHALTAAVEDTLTRWHRMRGDVTLYVPGTDHAGIATQSVVEKMLMKESGVTRHELGRDAFIKKVWEWKEEYGGKITRQLRSLGSSVDWSRERFTMDELCSKAVVEAFNRFHEDGLLYRQRRMGNWSCALKSAISDIEVDYIELEGRTFLNVPNHKGNPKDPKGRYEFGTLTEFAYPIIDGKTEDEKIIVATTRLETMLGDTAVAVHPEDPRYKHLHGKFVLHPFTDRKIPIICDSELVDMEFGTGAVKITPAHDPNDYQCGMRHKLEFITVLTEDGAMADNCGQFAGMMRYDARIAVEEALEKDGLYVGKKPNKMRLGLCSRSKDVLEPMITPQWYVNCSGMAKRSVDAVKNGELKIIPEEHEKTWFYWLENIQDWCVSRQLWWGHQIPAWFATTVEEGGSISKNDMDNNDRWIVARNEEEALVKAAEKLQTDPSNIKIERDEDVLDTWFSSGLFPFSVMGWPDNTADLKAFYPTSLLETGLDILFFWVARMVMMGLQLTDTLPFHTVYLHAMVRDKEGRKMSKSLGNVIDPLEVINGCTLESLLSKLDAGNLDPKEVAKAKKDQSTDFPDGIPQCGSDALRFGLLAYTVQGRDVNLDIKRVVGYRQFCNKLWNATRFALQFVSDFKPTQTLLTDLISSGKCATRDRFMISKLAQTCNVVNDMLTNYKFGDAQSTMYAFWIDDLCSLYLELIKPVVYDTSEANYDARWAAQATLWLALESGLRLLHPMMPYVTEELWQRLPGRGTLGDAEKPSIMLMPYPDFSSIPDCIDEKADASMAVTKQIIDACRSLRSSYNIANKTLTKFYIKIANGAPEEAAIAQTSDIQTLGKAETVFVNVSDVPKSVGIVVIDDQTTVCMDLAGMIDFKAEITKLQKSLKKMLPALESLEKKINADGYEAGTTAEFRAKNAEKLEGLQKKKVDIETAIENFNNLAAMEKN